MIALRDPISSITHLIGGVLSIIALIMMIAKQLLSGNLNAALFASSIIFGVSMILLYFTSGIYHAIDAGKQKAIRIMRKIDHSMIFVLIAGSYSPFCLYVLPKNIGIPIFVLLWIIVAAGIITKIAWINMPRQLSAGLYIAMGWISAFLIKDLYLALQKPAFALLIAGGVLYSIGGVIYAIKKPNFKVWNFHDIFHIFIMLGTLMHFLLVFLFLL